MAVRGVLYLRVAEPYSDEALEDLRARLMTGANLDRENDLYAGGRPPLQYEVEDQQFMPDPGAHWYEVNLIFRYHFASDGDRDYDKIHPVFIRCAEWLEAAVPQGEMWYGNDCSDESIKPFGPNERTQRTKMFQEGKP